MTFDEVLQAAEDKGYISMFGLRIPPDREGMIAIETACIMAWLTVKHKQHIGDLTLMKFRMKKDLEGVLTTIHEAILRLN